MGTWKWGPFDNDMARDVVRQLADGTFRMDQFRFDCCAQPLDSEQAQALIAVAAVMNGFIPDEAFSAARSFPFSADDRRWVRHSVRRVMCPAGSDLYDLWEEAGELREWLTATARVVGGAAGSIHLSW